MHERMAMGQYGFLTNVHLRADLPGRQAGEQQAYQMLLLIGNALMGTADAGAFNVLIFILPG